MPGLSGVELARALSEDRPEMKVIYLTGSEEIADSDLPPGRILLRKPISGAELSRTIRKVLDG